MARSRIKTLMGGFLLPPSLAPGIFALIAHPAIKKWAGNAHFIEPVAPLSLYLRINRVTHLALRISWNQRFSE